MSRFAERPDENLPRDERSGTSLAPREQPGYYPGFSTMAQQDYWDATTRALILKRVKEVPEIRFFTPQEAEILQAVLDRVIPQDDRVPERRIPVLNSIDERLHEKRFDGYIFEGMPEEDRAHRLALQAIELMAAETHGRPFVKLSNSEKDALLKSLRDGEPLGAKAIWKEMSPRHYWGLLVQDAAGAYYAHPWAWDEIGFGGPAYPRGYMRVTNGQPEPWEKREKRYDWLAPADSLSDEYRPLQGPVADSRSHGEAGTH